MTTNLRICTKSFSTSGRGPDRDRSPEFGIGQGHGQGNTDSQRRNFIRVPLVIGLSLLTIGMFPHPALAQEKSPKHFYPKNYASGNKTLEKDRIVKHATSNLNTAHQSDSRSTTEIEDASLPSPVESPSDATQALPNLTEGSGIKIDSASIILSTTDRSHAERAYEDFISLRDKVGIKLSDVYLIGDPRGLMDSNIIYSQGPDGGMFRYLNEMPKPFENIKTSPTIVLETKDGTILLEGFRSIISLFNSKGEFVEPK